RLRLALAVGFPIALGLFRLGAPGQLLGLVHNRLALGLLLGLLVLFLLDFFGLVLVDDTGLEQLILKTCHTRTLGVGLGWGCIINDGLSNSTPSPTDRRQFCWLTPGECNSGSPTKGRELPPSGDNFRGGSNGQSGVTGNLAASRGGNRSGF